jgi:hypothetical protein
MLYPSWETPMGAVHTRPVAHVRFEGRSLDVALADLGVSEHSPERPIRAALARHFDVPEARLDGYVLDRHANGNVTLRPEAVYG